MTNVIQDKLLPVEQIDREAAAKVAHLPTLRDMIAEGSGDHLQLVQAFARHRTNHTMPNSVVEARRPVEMYIYKVSDHEPLDDEGLAWLANQLCSEERIHPDRTMSVGWVPAQAAYEFPALWDRLQALATLSQQPQAEGLPEITAVFETKDGRIMGSTAAPIKRIDLQDDGTITVVINHWPHLKEQTDEQG